MKAIITDLDKTLLHTDKSLSAYTTDVLHQCKRKGFKLIVATARPLRDTQMFQNAVGFDAVITGNGAILSQNGQTVQNCISHTDAQAILSILCQTKDSVISMETSDGFFANVDIPEWSPMIYHGFPNLPTDGKIYKILISNPHDDLLPVATSALTENTYLTVAHGYLIQIMDRTATKWNGIKTVLEKLGIDPSDSIYFGDDYDDIEPIRNCGLGIAVGNAIEPVKKVADLIVADNDSDGVAAWLAENIL